MSKESAMALATGQPAPNPATARGALQTQAAAKPTNTAQPAARKSPGQLAEEAAAEAATAAQTTTTTNAEPTQEQRMAGLLKKETGLVREREAFKKEREKFEAEKRELLERTGRADKVLERGKQFDELMAKNDAMSALKLIGFTDNQIVEIMARAGQEKTPIEIAKEAAREEAQKAITEQEKRDKEEQYKLDQQRNNDVVTQFRGQISDAVTKSAEKYPMVAYAGSAAAEQIFLNIEEAVRENQKNPDPNFKMPTIDEAMKELEELYVYDYDQKAAIRNKAQQQTAPQEAQPGTQPNGQQQQQPASGQRKQIIVTNQMGTRATTQAVVNETPAQKRARLERVLATGDTTLLKSPR